MNQLIGTGNSSRKVELVGYTVPLDLNFTYARAQKATACNIHGNAPE